MGEVLRNLPLSEAPRLQFRPSRSAVRQATRQEPGFRSLFLYPSGPYAIGAAATTAQRQKSLNRQLGISDRVLDILVAEIGLQSPCIVALISQSKSAGFLSM